MYIGLPWLMYLCSSRIFSLTMYLRICFSVLFSIVESYLVCPVNNNYTSKENDAQNTFPLSITGVFLYFMLRSRGCHQYVPGTFSTRLVYYLFHIQFSKELPRCKYRATRSHSKNASVQSLPHTAWNVTTAG